MNTFPTAREAKEFLISRIVAEAQRENVPLSEIERKMLYFSETGWTLPDMMEVNDEFDRQYDQQEYEKKIARLVHKDLIRLRKGNPHELAVWKSAAQKLSKEDHYLSVMIDGAGASARSVSDHRKGAVLVVFGIFLLFALLLFLYSYIGLGPTKLNAGNGGYSIDERNSKTAGYFWLSLVVLYFCGAGYAHFDPKRRVYSTLDSFMHKLFGRNVPR